VMWIVPFKPQTGWQSNAALFSCDYRVLIGTTHLHPDAGYSGAVGVTGSAGEATALKLARRHNKNWVLAMLESNSLITDSIIPVNNARGRRISKRLHCSRKRDLVSFTISIDQQLHRIPSRQSNGKQKTPQTPQVLATRTTFFGFKVRRLPSNFTSISDQCKTTIHPVLPNYGPKKTAR